MANTAANVVVAVTGSANYAPSGTALPTTALSALDAAFKEAGYISENGVTQSIGADSTEIKAWQNADIVRTVQTSHSLTYQFEMMESSAAVLEAYYGNYTAGAVQITGAQPGIRPWVFNVLDGSAKVRIVAPFAQITERGDVSYVNGDAVMYPVTLTCYPDAGGVKAYMYTDSIGGVLVAPVLGSALPITSAAAGGELVIIRGSGFMFNGNVVVTNVTFGGTASPQFEVIDNSTLAAVSPTRPAGSQPIIVTNSAGASIARPFTYV